MTEQTIFSQGCPINPLHEEILRKLKHLNSKYPILHLTIESTSPLTVRCGGYRMNAVFQNTLSVFDVTTCNRIAVYEWDIELPKSDSPHPVLLISNWEFKPGLEELKIDAPFVEEDPGIVEKLFKIKQKEEKAVAEPPKEVISTIEPPLNIISEAPTPMEEVKKICNEEPPQTIVKKLTISKLKEYFEYKENEEKLTKNTNVKELLQQETGLMILKIQ